MGDYFALLVYLWINGRPRYILAVSVWLESYTSVQLSYAFLGSVTSNRTYTERFILVNLKS